MNYYVFSAIIFANGNIRDAFNLVYKSQEPSTIVEFKKYVEGHYAGRRETYNAIVIVTWNTIDEVTYNHIKNS
jgi:hypothetical protein